jgi:N-terminal domain of anti-restriction factor ArdC/IrrE N-terminal-like domain
MSEEITRRQSVTEGNGAGPVDGQGVTGSARSGAERKAPISWAALLNEAVTKPGYIHEAYTRFHSFSFGNQLLALFQCFERRIQPGPIATMPRWNELGRRVKPGSKALTLCMPLSRKTTKTTTAEDGTEQHEDVAYTYYVWRARWFVLSQTEGADYQPPAIPKWNEEAALAALNIQREAFEDLDGNVQGYAKRGRKIAVSPLAFNPFRTLAHETAHVLLGHTGDGDLSDSEATPRDLREVEAEAVALLCCESLSLPGAEYSRGYIQSWGRGQTIGERSAQRIFHSADQILRAGRPAANANQEAS